MTTKQLPGNITLCTCGLPNCPGKGQPWTSHLDHLPKRCRWCKSPNWNRKPKEKKEKS
jgi:hypothetical protein